METLNSEFAMLGLIVLNLNKIQQPGNGGQGAWFPSDPFRHLSFFLFHQHKKLQKENSSSSCALLLSEGL